MNLKATAAGAKAAIAGACKRVLRAAPEILREGTGFAGVGCLSYGAWLAWHPAGFMLGGVLLIAVAWILGRGEKPAAPAPEV